MGARIPKTHLAEELLRLAGLALESEPEDLFTRMLDAVAGANVAGRAAVYVKDRHGPARLIACGGPKAPKAWTGRAAALLRDRPAPPPDAEILREGGESGRVAGVILFENVDRADRRLAVLALGSALTLWREAGEARAELVDENYHLREEAASRARFEGIVGESAVMVEALKNAQLVAASNATVLILGETGTGKELLARAVHNASARANGPFVRVNCGALAESLLESELFGHVKGAFTGALRDHKGRFELASGGTLLLDEIGDMSERLQVRLLRALEEREIERVGDATPRPVDIRVLAATHRDLDLAVRHGRFREDLYYRLNVVTLPLPPLRERAGDVPRLVEFFIEKYNAQNAKNVARVPRRVLAVLERYPWPGNVRELENCVERVVTLAEGEVFDEPLLPLAIRAFEADADERGELPALEGDADDAPAASAGGLLAEYESRAIRDALGRARGVVKRAAELLGVHRNTLATRMRALKIPNPRAPRKQTPKRRAQ